MKSFALLNRVAGCICVPAPVLLMQGGTSSSPPSSHPPFLYYSSPEKKSLPTSLSLPCTLFLKGMDNLKLLQTLLTGLRGPAEPPRSQACIPSSCRDSSYRSILSHQSPSSITKHIHHRFNHGFSCTLIKNLRSGILILIQTGSTLL